MKIDEICTQTPLEEASLADLKKYAKGAAVAGGIAGAAAFGFGGKDKTEPVKPPVAITQPATIDADQADLGKFIKDLPDQQDKVGAKQYGDSTSQHVNSAIQDYVKKSAMSAGITGVELAAFLAQVAHESQSFTRLNELGNDQYFKKNYDIKGANPEKAKLLGNLNPGDGARYHGRGFIHLTGKTNYRIAGEALGIDLVKHPELAAKPEVAAKIAVWFWKTRVQPNVSDWNDVRSVTRKINPAMQGIDDREANFDDYKKKLKV